MTVAVLEASGLSEPNKRAIRLMLPDLIEESERIQGRQAFGKLVVTIDFDDGRAVGTATVELRKTYKLTERKRA